MSFSKEVHALEELVTGDYPVAAPWVNYGSVVADAKSQGTTLRRWDPAAYPINQFVFENSQLEVYLAWKLYSRGKGGRNRQLTGLYNFRKVLGDSSE